MFFEMTVVTRLCLILTLASLPFVSSDCPAKCQCKDERKGSLEDIVVDCSHQRLTSIPEFDPEESFSTWKLIMTGNPLGSIPSGAVKNLTNLSELDLSDCSITEIHEEGFAGPARLERLFLKDNLISDLPEHMFHYHSPALSDLNLSGNQLTFAKFVKAGKYLIGLNTLNLSNNKLRQSGETVIPAEFGHLTGLKTLDLSHATLGHIGDRYFAPFRTLVQLELLDLSYNSLRPSVESLRTLPPNLDYLSLAGNSHLGLQDNLRNTLYGIPDGISIRVLNLSDVGLTGPLQAKAFDFIRKLDNLEVLDLSSNRLTSIDPPDLSRKMPYIKTLQLQNNMLKSIKSLALMDGLNRVNLSGNLLEQFPLEIFHLPELVELSVSHNKLKRISVPRKYKEKMLLFKLLDLSHNKISTLLVEGNSQLWNQFPALKSLDLSFNFLSNVDPMMGSLKDLEMLDIRHNRFSQIHNNLYELIGKLRSLFEVRMKSNPFQCTCRWLTEAARKIPKYVMISGLASTVCRTDLPKGHAPTVAGFADATCHVNLPGTPPAKGTGKENSKTFNVEAEAIVENPSLPSEGLSGGVTALIVLIVLGVVVAVGVLIWMQGHRIKAHFTGGQMSYTEILDEYHPPNGGGVPL